jgi:hypothetical protein
MRGNWVSFVLAFICVGFIVGATLSFIIPYPYEENILSDSDLGIFENLTVPYHTRFPQRSYEQVIDISLQCTNGSLDIIVLKSTEWDAWTHGENYTPYFEATNVTSVMTAIDIDPAYMRLIDIILETNYGYAEMSVRISSHCMWYDVTTGVNSLLVAIPFAVAAVYYGTKETKNDETSIGIDVA